jgi:hypothetical protein
VKLAGTWLVVNCQTPAHGRYFSINGLAEKHGVGRMLGELLPRFAVNTAEVGPRRSFCRKPNMEPRRGWRALMAAGQSS